MLNEYGKMFMIVVIYIYIYSVFDVMLFIIQEKNIFSSQQDNSTPIDNTVTKLSFYIMYDTILIIDETETERSKFNEIALILLPK